MDVVRFNLVRPLASAKDDDIVHLASQLTLPPAQTAPDAGLHASSTVSQPTTLTLANLPDTVGSAADDPLHKSGSLEGASPLQRTYMLINQLGDWLSAEHDRASGKDVAKAANGLSTKLKLADTTGWAIGPLANADQTLLFQVALLGLRQALIEAMNPATLFQNAALLTRSAEIANLLARPPADLNGLSGEEVYGMINRRPVILAGMPVLKIAPKAQIKLIREAKVADLQVVRSEWKAFIPSEVANIRNLMVGESFTQRDKTVSQTDTTVTSETQQSTDTQQQTQTKLDSELSQQISTQLGITVNGHFDASASFSYPQITASVSAGLDASLSIQKSETQASKIAREAVTQAVSQVDSMTRESRTREELMRTEQGFKYELKNETGHNVHAVYRWVDRIDNYQVFRFPDRFLLEFQIPEPAEYYRWRTNRTAAETNAVDAPPDWTLKAGDITADKLVQLAAQYRASDLPAAPDPSISVGATMSLEADKASLPTADSKTQWNMGPASKDLTITIPPSYVATAVYYSGEGYPIRGVWRGKGGKDFEGWHSAFATVCVGKFSANYWNGGIAKDSSGNLVFRATHGNDTDMGVVEVMEWDLPEPPYGRATLPIGSGATLQPAPVTVDLTDSGSVPGVPNTLNVSVTSVGLANCALSFYVKCDLSAQGLAAWQLSVYDALYAAWAQWKKDYQSAQMRQQLTGTSAADAGGTERNQQIIREELKREVISWLLDEQDFSGRPELLARPAANGVETSFADFDFGQARIDAPVIQFMEQAFEWNNMTYMFYPYYWANRKTSWDTLSQITANDPDFERFLRAGSSRVIVPALPGFESAVQNWLMYKIPFLNGQLPAPDDPLYVSIDQEIRNITSPWQGGIAGDSWQSRISTTLLYLEQDGDLPFQNDEAQLPAEQGVMFTPKTY